MLELKELHHHHISILGFNHISEWTLQQLLLYYAKMYLPTYEQNDPDQKVVSKIFNYLKGNNIKLLKSMKIFNYDEFVCTVYTDDSKEVVKDEINITSLDIDVVVNVLKLVKCFPVKCNTKKFACSQSKRCNNCLDKSNCSVFGSIKRAIDALLKVRHLAAHQAKDVWIQLQNGTFESLDFPGPKSFHQLWDIYTDHLKTVIMFLNDNNHITKTQKDDRTGQLVKYGTLKDSSVSDSKIMEQYANYVMAHEGNQLINKSINISFDVKIPDIQLSSSVLSLDGELMDHVTSFAEVFITTLSGVKDVEIIRRGCVEEQQHTNLASVRVEITIAHRSPFILQDYTNMGTEQSKKFRDEFFKRIKAYLDRKYDTVVNIFLKEWKPGSIKMVFNIENLKTLDVQFGEFEEFMEKQLALLIPDCLVNLFIQHKGSKVKMEKKLFLSFSVILLAESVEDLPTDVEIKVKESLRSEAEKYVLKKQPISCYDESGATFENEIFSRERKEDINMVLLGKSGIGKSTWVNSFFNFLMLESFESGLRDEKVCAPIHTQFKHADMSIQTDCPEKRLITIEVGEKENLCDEYAMGNVNASATKMPFSHIVESKDADYVIRLIDTPGVKSTVGKSDDETTDEVDQSNIDMILDHISQYPYINAFIVMLKPDEEKFDPTFASILKTLFGQLGESARKNVTFAFTHSHNCDFQDTKTVSVLSSYLNEIDLDIKIKDCNVFYFDSSPFRYLATVSQGYTPKGDRRVMKDYWNKSVESCKNMIKYVDEKLEKHDTKETLAISDARSIITMVVEPLVHICKINEQNIDVVKKLCVDLAEKSGISIVKTVDIRQKSLTLKTLDKPLTVCTHRQCCDKQIILEDGQKAEKILHREVCCKGCNVPFVPYQVKECSMLYFCEAMTWGGMCKVCKHPRNEHMHIFYEMLEAEIFFKMEMKDIFERKNQLEKELEFIVETLAFFSKFLERHSLIKDRDMIAARIEEITEKAKRELGGVVKIIEDAEKKVQENSLPSKDEIEKRIRGFEEVLTTVKGRKHVVNKFVSKRDFWNLYIRSENAADGEFSYEMKVKNLKAKILVHLKEDNVEGMDYHEYLQFLKLKENSLIDSLKKPKQQLLLIEDLENAHRQHEEKTMLIDGLEKMLQKYEMKLSYERNDLTPANVTTRFNTLCELEHNGPSFKQIHDYINERRNNDMVKQKKRYRSNNIPFQRFLRKSRRPIEN